MNKRTAAKKISNWNGDELLVCFGISCHDCPLYPCNNGRYSQHGGNQERKDSAALWLRDHPTTFEKIRKFLKAKPDAGKGEI